MYTTITTKVLNHTSASSEENFHNIQILNVIEALNSNKTTIYIDDIIKMPCLKNTKLLTNLDKKSLDYIVNSVSSNEDSEKLFKRFVKNSDIKSVFDFLLFPKKSLKIIYSL